MSAVESGCALLQLPCELRDMIYSYCFDRTYMVFWPKHDDRSSERDIYDHCQLKPVIADLSILRTSTALSSDAKHFLFCRAASKATTFRYHIDFNHRRFSPPPVKEATDRMMNVEFRVLLSFPDVFCFTDERSYQGEKMYPASIMEQMCEDTLDRFTGTEIVRNSFEITINFCRPDKFGDFVEFVETRFFQALKSLKGFQKVTISLVICSVRDEDEDRHLQEGFAKVVADLKTHLGPCIEKNHDNSFPEDIALISRLELKFQPRKFYLESLRAEAERAAKGVDGLGEEHTQEN